MSTYFDSRDPACKSPFGAVPCGTEVSFAVFCSPEEEIIGGELRDNDDWTLALLTNAEVLRLTGHSYGRRRMAVRVCRPCSAGAGVVQLFSAAAQRRDRDAGAAAADGI